MDVIDAGGFHHMTTTGSAGGYSLELGWDLQSSRSETPAAYFVFLANY